MDAQDRATLRFLALQRVATNAHVQSLLGLSEGRTAERVRRLTRSGHVRSGRIFDKGSRTVLIARRGLHAVGSPLPPPGLNLTEYRHDVGVAWLWLAAQRGAFGDAERVVSERELRLKERGPDAHRPDLLVRTADGRGLALELDLTRKSAERLDRVMLAYAGDPDVDAVLYLVPDRGLAAHVGEAAGRAGISSVVRIQRLASDAIHGAPAEQRALASGLAQGDRLASAGRRGSRTRSGAGQRQSPEMGAER